MDLVKLLIIVLGITVGFVLSGVENISNAKELKEEIELLTVKTAMYRQLLIIEDKVDELKKEHEKVKIEVQKEQYSYYETEVVKYKYNDINVSSFPSHEEKTPLEEHKEDNKSEKKAEKIIFVEASAYTAYCKGCTGKTSTGIDVRETITYNGMCIIAVDPKVIPLWSKVKVNGKDCVAADKGGAIKGNKIDILVGSYKEAMNFGRQHNIEVQILGTVK